MNKINWKVRFSKNNILFIAQVIISVVIPILTYFGLQASDLTTWAKVWDTLIAIHMLLLWHWFLSLMRLLILQLKASEIQLLLSHIQNQRNRKVGCNMKWIKSKRYLA
mgnify:CR=1 FL=1